jgi:Fur family transcriptional regulator, ferric uptake regulator
MLMQQFNLLKRVLKEKNLKCTPERKAIFREVEQLDTHFDADELFLRLYKKHSKVSRGSVYRTLRIFEEVGIIRAVVFTERHSHYERIIGKTHHSHLICIGCGKIIEFLNTKIATGLKEAYKKHCFKEFDHKIESTGLCRKCQKKK